MDAALCLLFPALNKPFQHKTRGIKCTGTSYWVEAGEDEAVPTAMLNYSDELSGAMSTGKGDQCPRGMVGAVHR